MLHETVRRGELSYGLRLFSVDGRLKMNMYNFGHARLCFNTELEGLCYCGSNIFGTLFIAEWTNDNSKSLFEGRRPDP